MKIAIISFHNAYNYGAALQAYALQEAISEMGAECEYIDYVNDHRKESYDMKFQLKKALKQKNCLHALRVFLGIPFITLRGKKFDEFYLHYLKKTRKRYHSSAEVQELNDEYDKFVVGSDQVWNPNNNGGDCAYLLDFVHEDDKCISYSPSFGVSNIPDDLRENYKKCLDRFDRLGVREERGIHLVQELTGRTPHLILDPVFLLSRDVWERFIIKRNKRKYIFFYTNDNSEIDDFLATGYDMRSYEAHILSTKFSPIDCINPKKRIKVSVSIENFLNEIASAELVVTSSFHCLAFAIIFRKQFVVILTGNSGKDERLITLLKLCGLETRILTAQTCIADIDREIEYCLVDEKLSSYVGYSKEYLYRAIYSKDDVKLRMLDEEKKFCSDERCTGCTACFEICPVGAIEFIKNAEGFYSPKICREKCISCKKCYHVCQVFVNQNINKAEQSFWCVKNSDEIRERSSSGGAFGAISEVVLREKGVIVGAVMTEGFRVQHILANCIEDRDRMMNTYYVQSDLRGVFPKIKELLEQNRKVMFIGLPCQVQGLKLYLGKTHERLITCDLICHGVPSPGVFESFIGFLKRKGNLTEYKFRDKEVGWRGYTESAVIDGKKYKNKQWLSSFTNLFSHNVINRKSCANCQFASTERVSDITLGDFWGVHSFDKSLDDGKGVSLVICNSKEGKALFEEATFYYKKELSREQSLQNSLKKPSASSKNRMHAMRLYNSGKYEQMARLYGEWNIKGGIKRLVRNIILKAK